MLRTWAGWIVSGIAVLFMLFDAVIHVLKPPAVAQSFNQLGVPVRLATGLGVLEIACTVIYVIPQTSVLGAILLTGYLGGATATQLRAGADPFSTVFPAVVGVMVWGGLFLHDARVRALIPVR